MTIKFQIIKAVIIEAVKSTTYLKGKVDSASDDKAVKVGRQETAGDEEVHERTLAHDFQTALEMLKTFFVDYLTPTAQTIGDNVIYYGTNTDDVVEFTLDVSRRYNGTLTDALARLSARYIEDYMLNEWWIKTTNVKQAEIYTAKLQSDEIAIRKCFILSSPAVPTFKYTTELEVKVDGEGDDGVVEAEKGTDLIISYTISDGSVDDIEAMSDNPSVVEIHRCANRCTFTLRPVNTGIANVRLFSRHTELEKKFDVVVAEEEGYE